MFDISDETQTIFRKVLQVMYEKGQEDSVSLLALLQDASDMLRPLVSEKK